MIDILSKAVRWLRPADGVEAKIVTANDLPPSADGPQYRYEIVVRLADATDEPPDETEVRQLAESVRAEIDDIDDPEWEGVDELYIQLYGPDREIGAGACGTARWIAGEGYEPINTRPYLF